MYFSYKVICTLNIQLTAIIVQIQQYLFQFPGHTFQHQTVFFAPSHNKKIITKTCTNFLVCIHNQERKKKSNFIGNFQQNVIVNVRHFSNIPDIEIIK